MLKTFGPLADPVTAVAFSKDFLQVGAAAGKVVKVWTVADGKEVATLTHPADVLSLAFNADKSRIVTGAADKEGRVWDVATGKLVQFFPHAGPVRGVAFHANNTMAITGSDDKTVAVHTLGMTKAIQAGTPLHGLALVPAGTHMLTAGADKSVKLWNLATGAMEKNLRRQRGRGSLRRRVQERPARGRGRRRPDRAHLHLRRRQAARRPSRPRAVIRSLAFSPNNLTLAAGCENNVIQSWNVAFTAGQPLAAEFGQPQQTYTHAGPVNDLVFSPDSSLIYSASADKTVKVWKSASELPTRNFGHPNYVDAVAFNPDGKLLATGCHDGKVRIFDLVKGTPLKEINAHVMPIPAAIYALAWTADGKQLFSASFDRTVKLWDATAGTLVREFKGYKEKDFEKGHRDGVFCIALSPDGKTLATGSSDRTIKLWNVADGSVVRELVNPNIKVTPPQTPQSHPGWVYGVRFTPDGKSLVSTGMAPRQGGFLAVWNVADGKMAFAEELPFGTLFSLAMTSDGQRLAVATGAWARGLRGKM